MNINIKTKNIELTNSIAEYIEKKIGELDKFLQGIGGTPEDSSYHDTVEVDVEVGKINHHHQKGDIFRAEINIAVPGTKNVLRTVSEEWDLYVAIDKTRDEMQRQIKRYKGKRDAKSEKGKRKLKRLLRLSKLARRKDE